MKPNIIETPMLSVAKFVKNINGKDVYYDGCEYWIINEAGIIESIGNDMNKI